MVVRAAIESSEDQYGDDANINYKAIESQKQIGYFERARRVREAKYNWIFAHRSSQFEVQDLINRIENNNSPPNTTEEFSHHISIAYNVLSNEIKKKVSEAGHGIFDFLHLTTNIYANRALKIFLSRYDFEEPTVLKKKKVKDVIDD